MGIKRLIKSLREVLGSATRSRTSKTIVLCPRCRSEDIRPSSWLNGWLTPMRYYCQKRCGYVGPVVLEVEKD